jgi:hypothetical protein
MEGRAPGAPIALATGVVALLAGGGLTLAVTLFVHPFH